MESPPAPAEPTRPDMDQTRRRGRGDAVETLRLEGVGKTFDNVRAVHDVTLTAHSGTRKVILGPNGAGKTTLFNLITGVYKPSSGNIFLFGENVTTTAPHARTGMGLGRTFQVTNLFPTLTVMNNVRLGVLGVKRKKFAMHVPVTWLDDVNERCRDLLEMAGLWDERDTRGCQPLLRPSEPARAHGDPRVGSTGAPARRAGSRLVSGGEPVDG